MAAKTMEGRLPTAEELAAAYRKLIDGTDPLATVAWQFRHVIGTVDELKAKTGKPEASLDDAFIYFTGSQLEASGNFREIRRARRTEQRLH